MQKGVRLLRKQRKDVSCESIKRRYNLPCCKETVRKHILKGMKWKYSLRSRKPAVPAGEGLWDGQLRGPL